MAPDARQMAQVLRLAVALIEPGEDPQNLGRALRTHQVVERDELIEVEIAVGGAPALEVAGEQRILEDFAHIHARILQQRDDVVGEAEKEFEAALKINPDFVDAKKQLDTVRKVR